VTQVLGFAARATVPQEIFMANIEVVAVAINPALELGDKEQRAGAALNALAQVLFSAQKVCARAISSSHATERVQTAREIFIDHMACSPVCLSLRLSCGRQVAICRFVKRKNGTLALTAMFANPIDPTEEQDRGHEVPKDARYRLYLTTLPFNEGSLCGCWLTASSSCCCCYCCCCCSLVVCSLIGCENSIDHREPVFPPVPAQCQPSHTQLSAAGELIDAMLMSEPLGGGSSDDDDDDDDDAAASSEPQRQFNPLLQRFYEAVQQRALNEDSRVPPRGEVELQKPVESMLKKAQSEIANFGRACPLEPNLEQARKRKFTATMQQDHAQSKGLDQSKGFDAFAHDAKRTKGTQSSSSAANDGSGAQVTQQFLIALLHLLSPHLLSSTAGACCMWKRRWQPRRW
jgi:hypothetical protein